VLFATTQIGVRPPKNSLTGPNSPLSIFARWKRCWNARLSSGTTAMDNNDMTVKGLRSMILFRRLEGRQFRPRLRLPATPKHRATAQDSELTSLSGMSDYRWHRFVQQPCGYPFVTVNTAPTECHLGVALSSCLAGKVRTLPLWTATRTG
jgi:hypothetical protein